MASPHPAPALEIRHRARSVILMLAEVKAVVESFDRGDTNAFDAVDAIVIAVEAQRAAATATAQRSSRRRDAA